MSADLQHWAQTLFVSFIHVLLFSDLHKK